MARFIAGGADEMDDVLWCLEWFACGGGGRPWPVAGFAWGSAMCGVADGYSTESEGCRWWSR